MTPAAMIAADPVCFSSSLPFDEQNVAESKPGRWKTPAKEQETRESPRTNTEI
jgi:hypothetical protein